MAFFSRARIQQALAVLTFFSAFAVLALSEAWAQAVPAGSTPAPGAPEQPNMLMSLAPLAVVFVVFYFLLIRPQQKKMKEQQEMISALKTGDEVLTASGILGKITGITEKVVTVEVADSVRVRMLKSQIAQVVKGSIKDLAEVR
jgi:preprotein translocase subunit YajC